MSYTYLIARNSEDDSYSVWAFDPSANTLLTQQATDPHATFPRGNGLTAVGGYLLSYGPLRGGSIKEGTATMDYSLFVFDPDSPDPLNAMAVQAGTWDQEKFWDYFVYKDCPHTPQTTALQLIGVTGYVLSFLPTNGRGTFSLWNFDADCDHPGTEDPIPDRMADQDAFPSIAKGHTLLPVENYVVDWNTKDGTYSVFSFDPQLPNPLSYPAVSSGKVPGKAKLSLVAVDQYILAWHPSSRRYTLYQFDPTDPFGNAVRKGELPSAFTPQTTLASVQTRVPIDDSQSQEPGTMDFMRSKIEHVVYYAVESRSFDNVLGWLYEQGTHFVNWVHAQPPFAGASIANTNPCGGKQYRQHKLHDGTLSTSRNLNSPVNDPFHGTPDSINQQWSGGYSSYHGGDPSDMLGFVENTGLDDVMASFTPNQMPILNGLAQNFAVSDEWFCGEAGGTTTNRATMASGSAFDITVSYESGPAYEFFPQSPHRQSVWKLLANNGITDWKIYYSVLWQDFPYTYHLYLENQVPSVDHRQSNFVQPIADFFHAARMGELPRFSFLEPIWFDPSGVFTSYHPSGDVIPGEQALNEIYEAIKEGPGWDKTMLVITFSKGGGLYDHIPAARMQKAWPNDENDGYAFDVTGARIPTIVVSPLVKSNTVFRSNTTVPFDTTSLLSTLLQWFGIPKARWGLGDRVPLAPTFETVLQESSPRSDAPTLTRAYDQTYPPGAHVPTTSTSYTSGTWSERPDTTQWTDPDNWDPTGVPDGKATFGKSATTTVTFGNGSRSTVQSIEFTEHAAPYTFEFTENKPKSPTLTIGGVGVVNRSRHLQTFAVTAQSTQDSEIQLAFTNSATAGDSNVAYSAAPSSPEHASGGIISFSQQADAGFASFIVRTGAKPPGEDSTVGAEIRFNDSSSAKNARFTLYGTIGKDGDTFGNVVFNDTSTADHAVITNIGGTVYQGDGGNTQFFDTSTAGQATIVNLGGTHDGSNGGDAAFDGAATAGNAKLLNEAAPASGAFGGVTSFNNNPPAMAASQGANAGYAVIVNQGAQTSSQGGGGHTELTGKYGSGSADHATIINGGTADKASSSSAAGHTIFSISGTTSTWYRPTAGQANITNHPGACEGAKPGYTQFAGYDSPEQTDAPTAGNATITNLGASVADAPGGLTKFESPSTAGNATLIALGGTNGGYGGRIIFYDSASGGTATIKLQGGSLDLRYYGVSTLTIGELEIAEGTIETQVGDGTPLLQVTGELHLISPKAKFFFEEGSGFEADTAYALLEAKGLEPEDAARFCGNSVNHLKPRFEVKDHILHVKFVH